MFERSGTPPVIIGTTSPIFVPRGSEARTVRPGQSYIVVQIHSAQAVFAGSIWERVRRLIITSQVSLNHPSLGAEPLRAIQRSREVGRNRAEQLGLSPNLVKLTPVTMTHLSVSIEFILDKENRLAALGSLINDDSFLSVLSLAPGPAMVAKTIGGLAQKVMSSFLTAEERQPILQFTGDFNFGGAELQEGYYVILGTRDEQNALPTPMPPLAIRNGELVADGQKVTRWSYVVFDIRSIPARTRELNEGAAWDQKLREAEDEAEGIAGNPYASDDERRQAWAKCLALIKEAQALLRSDQNYLRSEAEDIIKAAHFKCVAALAPGVQKGGSASISAWSPDTFADRAFLGIPPEEDLASTLDSYAERVAESRRILRATSIPT